MAEITSIHDEIFETLIQWNSDTRYQRQAGNPYFYMRSTNDKRFNEGFWFPGNEEYLCVSFWAGGDSLNKTPNAYFEVNKKKGCLAYLVARDSEDKEEYFEKMVASLAADDLIYKKQRNGIWIHNISERYQDFAAGLKKYLQNDKIVIDRFILDNDPQLYIDEFTSSFGFVSEEDFEKNYTRVKKQKSIIDERRKAEESVSMHDMLGPISEELVVQIIYRDLPYALKNIDIRNFQGIKNAELNNLPQNSQWIFITGENGYGKSSLLQAIALGITNDRSMDSLLADDSRIEVCMHTDSSANTIVRLKSGTSGDMDAHLSERVIGYGPVRLNTFLPDSRNISDKNSSNIASLFNCTVLLKNIQYELFAKQHTDMRVFKLLEEAVKKATDGRISRIDVNGEQVLFSEQLSNGDLLPAITLDKLAAGFRSVINMVGDIIVRFGDVFQNASYEDYSGIILIDEVENHLHPILQREIPAALSKVFPKIQFIATTHSPIPLLGTAKNTVILTVNRSLDVGVIIERLDDVIDFPNLLPNTILTSPVFGFHNIIPNSHDSNRQIRVEATFDEVLETDKRKEKINSYLSDKLTDEMLKLLKK